MQKPENLGPFLSLQRTGLDLKTDHQHFPACPQELSESLGSSHMGRATQGKSPERTAGMAAQGCQPFLHLDAFHRQDGGPAGASLFGMSQQVL